MAKKSSGIVENYDYADSSIIVQIDESV